MIEAHRMKSSNRFLPPLSPERRIIGGAPGLVKRRRELSPLFSERCREIEQFPDLFLPQDGIKFNPFSGEIHIRTSRFGRPTYSSHHNIDQAIKSVEHVLTRYQKDGGVEVEHTKQLIKLIIHTLPQFRQGKVTKEELDEMLKQAEQTLIDSNYISAKIGNRQALVKQLQAGYRKDSRQRINPLISRTRLASAWLKLIGELVKTDKIRKKYHHILGLLVVEKLVKESQLREIKVMMDEIMNFEGEKNQLKELVMSLKERCLTNLVTNNLRVVPYRWAGLMTRVNLFGFVEGAYRERHKDLIQAIAGDKQLLTDFSKQQPLDKVLEDYDYNPDLVLIEIKQRVGRSLYWISSVLGEEETSETLSPGPETHVSGVSLVT